MHLPRLPPLAGWVGGPYSDSETVTARLRAAIQSSLPGTTNPTAPVLATPAWTCAAPCVALQDGRVAAIRGKPVWRTTDLTITKAADDARAVLRAFRKHGPLFLEVLHGSFAVVVLDTTTRAVLLAVDRMGVERLTYCVRGAELMFATSAEVVARACGAEPRIRAQSLLSYLFFHMIPSPDTVFEGVHKIPPATAVSFRDGMLTARHYWQPDFIEPPRRGERFEVLKESLHRALTTAVTATQPDQRTGAFLSGGLDSSTVTGYLGKVTARSPRSFSIGFGFHQYDELRFARIANARFRCDPREYEVRPEDIVDQFALIAAEYDEPFGNASTLPTLCCARLARDSGVDHLLAGDGGDEIFAGNSRYADQVIFERYQRVPRVFRRGVLEPLLAATPAPLRIWPIRKARGYVAQANTPLPDRLESWNFLYRLGFDAVLHPEFAAAVDVSEPAAHMRSVYAASPSRSLLNRMLQYDWRLTLADNDLRKVGSMCDLAGVRVSYPMLHPDVIDVSLQVPPDLKMRGTHLRTFYKGAMADFLPQEIITKTKHGFGLPFGLWLQRSSRLAELIDANLASLRARRIVRPEFVDRLIQLHGKDDASYYGVMIWTLAMLEQWFREHRIAPA
jgi:asparagine synthase (glutamine-hydrolysing)